MIEPPDNVPDAQEPPPVRNPTDDADGNPDRMDTLLASGDPYDAALDPRD